MSMVVFCMKIIGSICIVLSGIAVGWLYGEKIEKRYKELLDLKRTFQIIYSDISYASTSFLEVLQHVKSQSLKEFQPFFGYVEAEIRYKSKRKLTEIWEEGMELHLQELHLIEKDRIELMQVGRNIGNIDRKQQLCMLQIYLDKLEITLQELLQEKEKKIKLYRTLGMLGSVFVVVMLL